MRLLGVELSRLRSRRAYAVLIVLGIVLVTLVIGGNAYSHRPVSEAEMQQAQAMADRQNDSRFVQRDIERCEAGEGFPRNFDCDQLRVRPEWFLSRSPLDLAEDNKALLAGITAGLAILALLIGATFIGAEWAAGTVSTLLLFQPRRTPVWLAKAVAVFLGTAVPAALLIAIGFGARYAIARQWGVADVPPEVFSNLAWMGARAALVVGLAALGGYAVVMGLRHTAAVLGLVLGYALAGEAVLRMVWDSSERWLLSNHLIAFIGDGVKRRIYPEFCQGRCRPQVIEITMADAALYLGVLTGLALLASWVVFSRRDVP